MRDCGGRSQCLGRGPGGRSPGDGRRPSWRLQLLACVLLCLPATTQGQTQERVGTLVEFDFDYPPETSYDLGESWSYGAILEIDSIFERNFDLDSRRDGDVAIVEPTLNLAFAYEPSERIRAFADLELRRDIPLRDDDDVLDSEGDFSLAQAYVQVTDFYDGFSLQLGRQRFQDEREWWYDEELDAARLFYRSGRFGMELSASRSTDLGNDFLNHGSSEESENYFFVGHYAYTEEAALSVYLLKLRNSDDREYPLFLGLRSIGAIGTRLAHWVDAAIVAGNDDDRDIRAYGFDLGISYDTELPLEPSFTLGLALGSGDSDPEDDVDREFRQTGFQESYFYYGEVLAPELSNLWITTTGIQVRPLANTAVTLLHHYYRQHQLADELRDVTIEQDPDGRHRELGHAVDLVFSYWGHRSLYLELILGAFFPGDAFASDASNAYLGELIISYEF